MPKHRPTVSDNFPRTKRVLACSCAPLQKFTRVGLERADTTCPPLACRPLPACAPPLLHRTTPATPALASLPSSGTLATPAAGPGKQTQAHSKDMPHRGAPTHANPGYAVCPYQQRTRGKQNQSGTTTKSLPLTSSHNYNKWVRGACEALRRKRTERLQVEAPTPTPPL